MAPTTIDSLPNELLNHIVVQLVGCDPRTDPCAYVYRRVPSALCLVSRRWKQVVTPFLYANFHYDGHPTKIESLWLFARTVVTRPALARLVRQLDLTTKGFQHPHGFPDSVAFLRHLRDLYTTNQESIKRAYKQVGWDRPYVQNPFFTHCRDALEASGELPDLSSEVTLEAYAKRSLFDHYNLDYNNLDLDESQILAVESTFKQGYLAPLYAIVHAHCPDLVRTHAHLAPTDVFHADIICWSGFGATDANRPQAIAFQKLESISIKPAISVDANGRARSAEQIGPCEITLQNCYYRLPKLKELFMMPARVRIGSNEPWPISHDSPIQKLTLQIHQDERFDYAIFFSMLKNLRQLSLVLPRRDAYEHGLLLHHKLWKVLSHLQDTLEYLDIYQGDFISRPGGPLILNPAAAAADTADTADTAANTNAEAQKDPTFCAPFAKFDKLKYLATTPLILHGNECPHYHGTKLASHLPPNLISLALYTENNSIERDAIFPLDTEERNLIAEAASLGIRAITLDSDINGPFPIDAFVEEAERHPHLSFQYDEPHRLLFGGDQAPFNDYSRPRFRVEAVRAKRNMTDIPKIVPRGIEVFGWRGELEYGRKRGRRSMEGMYGRAMKRARRDS
ncbi:hypothetical protein ASPCAL08352 [Aspergillus calidoustus]|uniref:F-box domain-containing protein n=1 Tax=Aspergillus calidoustus TaxID=454130 RepID=A0A0U5GQ48_ASPCI|nr:hypothetical protein ASPCAL08352 [Aspergillus calidoustus]